MSLVISSLFNMCISSGCFPDVLKIAKVTPIFKKGAKTEISNYRPISILKNIGKIFESLIHSRLKSFFESLNLFSKNQFGYRKERNTEMAALKFIERVTPVLSSKSFAICVFLDLSAAFDTVSRPLLLAKLYRYGVRGVVLKFLESYFSKRMQYTEFRQNTSGLLRQELGVVQGSRTGPLFFDIYSNDINRLCNDGEVLMYADDLCLTFAGDDLGKLVQTVNEKLDLLCCWFNFNRLAINPTKSEYMIVTTKNIYFEPEIRVGGSFVKKVSRVKYLGLNIDDRLRYLDHLTSIKSRLAQLCGVTYKLKNLTTLESAKMFYFSCIYSVVTYCIVAWGGVLSNSSAAGAVCKLHSKIATNLFRKFYPGTGCIFKSVKILKLLDIHKFHACVYMFKIIKLNLCPTVSENLRLRYPPHDHSTRNRNNLIPPFPRINTIKFNYEYQFITIWNNIPETIRDSRSVGIFKQELRNYFIETY